jgi:hypothetical protein
MSAYHVQLPAWLGIPEGDPGVDLGLLKKTLASRGVNARGWRLYLDYGDTMFDALGEPWIDAEASANCGPNAVAYLKLVAACEMDIPPPPRLVRSISQWSIPDGKLETIPPLFLRAAWKAFAAEDYVGDGDSKHAAQYIDEEVVPLASWYFGSQHHKVTDTNLLKSGWSALERRRYEWIIQREALSPAPAEWPAFVRAVEWEGLRFVSLASWPALEAEGAAMSHCIGSYDEKCHTRMLRAYSIRDKKSGARVATLTVEEEKPGRWKIDAIKGRQNAPVDTRIEVAAWSVVRALEDAYAFLGTTRADMNRTRRELGKTQGARPARMAAARNPDFEPDMVF